MNRTLKELARHTLHKAGWRRPYAHLAETDRGSRFSQIYATGVWTSGDLSGVLSGPGSTIRSTSELRKRLPSLLRELDCKTLLDVGCGDLTWISSVDLPCAYIGVDIVPSVIKAHQANFPDKKFFVADAVVDELPDADVLLCRETLFHLSFKDGLAALRNMASKARAFIILTSDRSTRFNADIETGDFRPLNLEIRPYHLPKPRFVVPDAAVIPERVLAGWKGSDLGDALRR